MKSRIISILLTLGLMISLVPAISAETQAEAPYDVAWRVNVEEGEINLCGYDGDFLAWVTYYGEDVDKKDWPDFEYDIYKNGASVLGGWKPLPYTELWFGDVYSVGIDPGALGAGEYEFAARNKDTDEVFKAPFTIFYKETVISATPALSLSKTSFTWNGKAQTPAVTVSVNDTVLPADKYTVSYPSGSRDVGTYTVKVTLKNGYSGSSEANYTIVPKGSRVKSLKARKKGVIVRWAKQSAKMSKARITGYQIQYSMKKDFRKGARTVSVKGYNKTSRKIGGLKAKKTYYVKVRTCMKSGGKTYWSGWSAARKFRTK